MVTLHVEQLNFTEFYLNVYCVSVKETSFVMRMSTSAHTLTHSKSDFFYEIEKKGCLNTFVNYVSNPGIPILYMCRAHVERKERYREFLIKMQSQQEHEARCVETQSQKFKCLS